MEQVGTGETWKSPLETPQPSPDKAVDSDSLLATVSVPSRAVTLSSPLETVEAAVGPEMVATSFSQAAHHWEPVALVA